MWLIYQLMSWKNSKNMQVMNVDFDSDPNTGAHILRLTLCNGAKVNKQKKDPTMTQKLTTSLFCSVYRSLSHKWIPTDSSKVKHRKGKGHVVAIYVSPSWHL